MRTETLTTEQLIDEISTTLEWVCGWKAQYDYEDAAVFIHQLHDSHLTLEQHQDAADGWTRMRDSLRDRKFVNRLYLSPKRYIVVSAEAYRRNRVLAATLFTSLRVSRYELVHVLHKESWDLLEKSQRDHSLPARKLGLDIAELARKVDANELTVKRAHRQWRQLYLFTSSRFSKS